MSKKYFPWLVLLILITAGCSKGSRNQQSFTDASLDFAAEQYRGMAELAAKNKNLPQTVDKSGKVVFAESSVWTSGFVPGTLWNLFDYTDEFEWSDAARDLTLRLEKEKWNKASHDAGLLLYCSFGNGYRLTGDPIYREVLLTGAQSLKSRFNPKVGCIKSWKTTEKWQFPVVIDNMMSLELMMWAFKTSRDSSYYRACISHADTTMKNNFRADYSAVQLVAYDTIKGRPVLKQNVQGASDELAWARGQSFGLYGYTVMYRETRLDRYLQQAKHIADFLIQHKNLPADKIPYWDYNAKDIPNAKHDVSAAAIMASALIELSSFVDSATAKKYLAIAETQLKSLSSSAYRAEKDENGNFILKNTPAAAEADVSPACADYYYVEALLRLRNLQAANKK
ncbi:MAG TPA: glucuronyl hydrolase [Bacteroidales bacterium]|nr:glucuronyl hydrolase [Bacteroidales bacterium]